MRVISGNSGKYRPASRPVLTGIAGIDRNSKDAFFTSAENPHRITCLLFTFFSPGIRHVKHWKSGAGILQFCTQLLTGLDWTGLLAGLDCPELTEMAGIDRIAVQSCHFCQKWLPHGRNLAGMAGWGP